MDKERIAKDLTAYKHSMSEFDIEEMEYLAALVNFDRINRILSPEDVDYWKDYKAPESTEPIEKFFRSKEASTQVKKALLEDLQAMKGIKTIDVP